MTRAADRGSACGDGWIERRDLIWAAGLVTVAIALRAAHLVSVADSPFAEILMLDPQFYHEWALRIVSGEAPPARPWFQDPLYAGFLAAIYATFGVGRWPVVAIQALLGALVPALVFSASRRPFGRPAAVVAGLFAACYAPAIYYDGLLLKTSLGVFLVAGLLALIERCGASERRVGWAAVGALLGLAVLARGNLLLQLPLLVGWAATRHGAPALRWRRAAALVAGCALVLGGSAVRNRVVGGEWVLATSNAGQNFYIGNNALNVSGEYQRLPFVDPDPQSEEGDFSREAARRAGSDLGPRATSRFWFGEARRWIAADPAAAAALVWRKLRVFCNTYEVPDNLDYDLYREEAPVLRWPLPSFGLLAPLGAVGALLAWRRGGWPRLLVLVIVVHAASVVAFFVFSRFRMAMMPAVWPLAGFAVVELFRRLRALCTGGGSGRTLASALFVLVAATAFVHLPARGRPDALRVRWAHAVGLPVQVERSATAQFNLGVSYARRAGTEPLQAERWLALAEQRLRTAYAAEGRFAQVPEELGKVLARQGRTQEAIEMYLEAAALEPGTARLHFGLGLLYERVAEPLAAAAAYERVLAIDPQSRSAARRLEALRAASAP